MRHLLLTAVAVCLSFTTISAQTGRELLRENPMRAANAYHVYEAPKDIKGTPVPEGFTPFYVSHYGRHGSRYHTSPK